VTGPDVVYDPDANVVTCGSLEVSGPIKPDWVSGSMPIGAKNSED
jgi:hypothetical protein